MKKMRSFAVFIVMALVTLVNNEVRAAGTEKALYALYDNVVKNDLEGARECIRAGTNVNARCGSFIYKDDLPLFLVKSSEMAKLLIANGAQVTTKLKNDWTLLHEAACGGKNWLISLCLEKGLNVNAKNAFGLTPLHLAQGNEDCARLLLEHGADVHAVTCDGYVPLHFARGAVVRMLLDHGANVNARNKDGNTPLDLLCPSTGSKTLYNLRAIQALIDARGVTECSGLPVAEKP